MKLKWGFLRDTGERAFSSQTQGLVLVSIKKKKKRWGEQKTDEQGERHTHLELACVDATQKMRLKKGPEWKFSSLMEGRPGPTRVRLQTSHHWGQEVGGYSSEWQKEEGLEKLGLRVTGSGMVNGRDALQNRDCCLIQIKRTSKKSPPKLCNIFRVCDNLE